MAAGLTLAASGCSREAHAFPTILCDSTCVIVDSEFRAPAVAPAEVDAQLDVAEAVLLASLEPVALPPARAARAPLAIAAAGVLPDLPELAVDYGDKLLGWILALLGAAATWLLVRVGASAAWRSLVTELGAHARDVVLEVWQTYVEALKEGRADGKLTDQEKRIAKERAVAKLRARLGWRKLIALGGGVLTKLFAGSAWAQRVEDWLGGAVETAVAEAKREGKAAGLGQLRGLAIAPLAPAGQESSMVPR
jgi:hypothetical protein